MLYLHLVIYNANVLVKQAATDTADIRICIGFRKISSNHRRTLAKLESCSTSEGAVNPADESTPTKPTVHFRQLNVVFNLIKTLLRCKSYLIDLEQNKRSKIKNSSIHSVLVK